MNDPNRLSQIETLWSVVRQAHGDQTGPARNAQQQLLERYGDAIHRYLTGALRDKEAADDVYQDFAVRFIRGDFQSATPDRGRFRSFLKTILFRSVADFHRAKRRNPAVPLNQQVFDPESPDDAEERERQFAHVWREEMLKRSWDALAKTEQRTGKPWYTLLKLRVNQPKLRSPELAEALSETLKRPISAANVRVMLHRSREQFAAALIEAISDSLNSTSIDEIEDELAELRLLDYCQATIDERRGGPKA